MPTKITIKKLWLVLPEEICFISYIFVLYIYVVFEVFEWSACKLAG